MLLALLWLLCSPAHAITDPRAGVYVHGGAGLDLDIRAPVAAGPGWQVGAGALWGRYDEDYALGRFTSLGVTVNQAWSRQALRTSPMVEVRRGTDVLILGWHGFLAVGPELGPGPVGVAGLLGLGVKYRFQPTLGVLLRVGGGGAYSGEGASGRVSVQLTFEWSRLVGTPRTE